MDTADGYCWRILLARLTSRPDVNDACRYLKDSKRDAFQAFQSSKGPAVLGAACVPVRAWVCHLYHRCVKLLQGVGYSVSGCAGAAAEMCSRWGASRCKENAAQLWQSLTCEALLCLAKLTEQQPPHSGLKMLEGNRCAGRLAESMQTTPAELRQLGSYSEQGTSGRRPPRRVCVMTTAPGPHTYIAGLALSTRSVDEALNTACADAGHVGLWVCIRVTPWRSLPVGGSPHSLSTYTFNPLKPCRLKARQCYTPSRAFSSASYPAAPTWTPS
jgi:hypothetical protein